MISKWICCAAILISFVLTGTSEAKDQSQSDRGKVTINGITVDKKAICDCKLPNSKSTVDMSVGECIRRGGEVWGLGAP